jgi:hypothetical protein
MKRKQTNGSAAADTTSAPPPTERIDFHKAVIEARDLLAQMDVGYYRLGQLVYEVAEAAEYGDRTLAEFAEEIRVAKCTLDRYANVYRSWKDILAPGPKLPSYAVLRELAPYATNPECAESIRDNPNITKREAQEIKRKLKSAAEEQQREEQENEWVKHNRKWFKNLVAHANEAARTAAAVDVDQCTSEQLENFREAIDPNLLRYVRGSGRLLIRIADRLAELCGLELEDYDPIPVAADAAPLLEAAE